MGYTPNYGSAREMYAYGADSFHGTDSRPENRAEFDRFIAKIRAEALRVAAIGVTTQVNNAEAAEADKARDPGPYYHGARYGMRKTAQWLHRRADRIEGEA